MSKQSSGKFQAFWDMVSPYLTTSTPSAAPNPQDVAVAVAGATKKGKKNNVKVNDIIKEAEDLGVNLNIVANELGEQGSFADKDAKAALVSFQAAGQKVVEQVKPVLATTKLFKGMKEGKGWGLSASLFNSDVFQASQDMIPQNFSIGGGDFEEASFANWTGGDVTNSSLGINQDLSPIGPGFRGGTHTNFSYNPTAAIGMGGQSVPTMGFQAPKMPAMPVMEDVLLAVTLGKLGIEAAKLTAKGAYSAYKYFNPDPKKLSKEEKKALKIRKKWFEAVKHPTELNSKMREFLEKYPNFDVNIPNEKGESAIHILAENFRPTAMKILMDHGACINALDKDGNTALHHAVMSDNKRAVEDLVKRGANINVANPKTGKTPIDTSHDVRNQLPDALDITAERSEVTALLDDTEKAGKSLIAAAKQGDEKKLGELLKGSPHLINYQNEKGETPIFAATQSNKMKTASFLTEKGANFAIENNDGIHAGNLAAQRVEDIVLNDRDETVLNNALKSMPKEMRGFSLAARDEEGNQIIHVAAANKSNQEVLKVLVDNGASLTSENNAKYKALEIATNVNAKEPTLDSYGGFDNPPSPEMEYLKKATVKEETKLEREETKLRNLATFNKTIRQKEQEPESRTPIRVIKEEGDKANTAGVEQKHKEFMVKRAFAELPGDDVVDVGGKIAKARISKDAEESKARKAFAELPLNDAIDVDRAKERIESDSKEMKEFFENVLDDSNIDRVKQALKANPLLAYAVDKDGGTALHFAAASGAEKVAEALIEAGADVNAQDKKLVTPLHDAVFENREKVVSSLMEHGANLSVEDDEGRTAADYAVLDNKSNDLVKHFAKSPGDRNGHTPFHYAASEGKYEAVQALLDAGADVDARDKQGKTMLHHAVMEDKPWLIKYLLEQGASVHIVDRNDMTPEELATTEDLLLSEDISYAGEKHHLITPLKEYREAGDALVAAANKGDEGKVKKMLKATPYLLNYRNNNDDTPLHAAASGGHKEVAELLVAKGANTTIANDQGKTAMDVAYGKANGWLKKELGFKNGGKEVGDTLADMNPHKLEQIQVRVAERQKAIDTLERLGKRVMAKRDNARAGRALMDAAANGEVDKVKEILEKRPNLVYGENLEGNTALHVAAENGHTEVLKLLVEKGARVSAENKEGKTALQVIQAQDESLWRHFSNQLNPDLYEAPTKAIEFLEAEQQKLDDLIKGLTPQKDVPLAIKDATPEQKAEMKAHDEFISGAQKEETKYQQDQKDRYERYLADKEAAKTRAQQDKKLHAKVSSLDKPVKLSGIDAMLDKARIHEEQQEALKQVAAAVKIQKTYRGVKPKKQLSDAKKDAAINAEEQHARENLVRLASLGSTLDVPKILDNHPKLLHAPMNEYGDSILHIAAEHRHPQLSKALVEMGANVLQKNDYGLDAYDLAQETADKAWFTRDTQAEAVMDILRPAMIQEKRRLAEEVLAKEAAIEAEQQKAELTANIMNDLAMSGSLSRINEDRTREDISTRDLKNLTKAAIENLEKIIEAKENVGRIIAENPGLSLSDVVKENYANVEDQLLAARELLESNKQLEGEIAATIKDEKSKAKLFANLPSSDSLEMDPEKEKKLQDAIQVNKEKAIQAKSQTTIAKRVRGIAGRQEVKQKIKREVAQEKAKEVVGEVGLSSAKQEEEKQPLTPNSLWESIDKDAMFEGRKNLKILMNEFLDKYEKDKTEKKTISLEDFASKQQNNLSKTAEDKAAALGRKMTGRATDADLFKEIVTNLAEGKKDPLEGIKEAKKGKFIQASKLRSKNQGQSR